jgi:hypothetical protein
MNAWIIGLEESLMAGLGEAVETPEITLLIFGDHFGEAIIVSAVKIHHGADVFAIHHMNEFIRLAEVSAPGCDVPSVLRFGRYANVCVHVDYRKPGTLDMRLLHVEHAFGFVLSKW